MEFFIKFFNNPNQKDHFKLKVDENFVKQGLFDAIVENIENNLQLRQDEFIILSNNGIKINEKSLITNGQIIQLCPTVLGGKGGFGSLLRAFGKQMQQSTNKEACRDLTGRRIRHVNNEKKLKDFLENQNETARLKEEKKREKIEARKKKRENLEKSHHLFVDPNYDKQKEKIAQDLDEAISKACTTKKDIKKSDVEKSDDKTSAEDKVSNDDKTSDVDNSTKANKSEKGVSTNDINKKEVPVSSGKKKLYSDWMGCDDLDVSSSDEDESDEDTKPATKIFKMDIQAQKVGDLGKLKTNEVDSDDDVPQLSADTLKALQEFYAENQDAPEKIDEDWQLSQFWYDKKTSDTLAKEVLTLALKDKNQKFNIACISCPTLYKSLRQYIKEDSQHPEFEKLSPETCSNIDIKVLEFDRRFEIYGNDFVFYDYKSPLDLYDSLANSFDLVIADPPFLSEECHTKTGMTIRKLGKEGSKLIICTGAIMEDLLATSLNVKLCSFIPRHERNLANEFKCYANYETLFLNQ